MGLQDRDYFREKQNKNNHFRPQFFKKRHDVSHLSGALYQGSFNKSSKNNIDIKYLIYPIVTIATLWFGSNYLLNAINNKNTVIPEPLKKLLPRSNSLENTLVSGGVILQADPSGHFRGIALINNIRMPFMIGTGATQTTIPSNLAIAARLPFGRSIAASTAGGQVVDQMTQINSLKLGNAEIKNLEATINQHIDEVLIGMNTLKYFHMLQNGNTLTLATYNNTGIIGSNVEIRKASENMNDHQLSDSFKPVTPIGNKAKATWEKITTCDEQKHCKTIYKDS